MLPEIRGYQPDTQRPLWIEIIGMRRPGSAQGGSVAFLPLPVAVLQRLRGDVRQVVKIE